MCICRKRLTFINCGVIAPRDLMSSGEISSEVATFPFSFFFSIFVTDIGYWPKFSIIPIKKEQHIDLDKY